MIEDKAIVNIVKAKTKCDMEWLSAGYPYPPGNIFLTQVAVLVLGYGII